MSDKIREALDWVDDFIARCNGDDRGSCSAVNTLRAAIAQQPAPVAVTDELRVKAEHFVAMMRKCAKGDREAERELADEDADESQACAIQASIQERAAAMVEQLLNAPAAAVAVGQEPVGEDHASVPARHRLTPHQG